MGKKAIIKSSLSQVFFNIGVLKHFENFTGKQLCWSVFLSWRQHGCFPVKFANFLRTPILIEHLRWLLLNISNILST